MDAFIELIQLAAGTRETLSGIPSSRAEWEELFRLTAMHNLLGVTFPVIDKLHDDSDIPLGVYTRWAMAARTIQHKNERMLEYCRDLYRRFSEDGFRTCIFKGQAAARRYPSPLLRQSGDIDIWVEGDRDAVLDYLRARYTVKKVFYHHCDAGIFDKVGVEVHFTPTWMNAPAANRKLQAYFESIAGEQFSNYNEELAFNVPTARFDAVYMLLHMLRHVLDEGLGLRQVLDYFYVLKDLSAIDREQVLSDARHLGLTGFASGIMYVLENVFGMDRNQMLCAPDESQGQFLLDEIMISGNFGRFDPRNEHEKDESHIRHARRKLSRSLRFLKYYPGEVLSMPYFMCWQFFWRRKHNYLYKGR